MSQPWYYRRNEHWDAWYKPYRAFLDALQRYLMTRGGLDLHETSKLLQPVLEAMEGDGPLCNKVMELLTEDEKQRRNVFTGEPA